MDGIYDSQSARETSGATWVSSGKTKGATPYTSEQGSSGSSGSEGPQSVSSKGCTWSQAPQEHYREQGLAWGAALQPCTEVQQPLAIIPDSTTETSSKLVLKQKLGTGASASFWGETRTKISPRTWIRYTPGFGRSGPQTLRPPSLIGQAKKLYQEKGGHSKWD